MRMESEKLLERAKECIEESGQLFDFEHYSGAINRAYYCIFNCTRALLHENGLYAKTHQGIQGKFSEMFIKTGLFERKHGEALRLVFDLRQTSDYDLEAEITELDAKYAIDVARQFLEATELYLKP